MDKFSSMLGLCRRAGKLLIGRDAVIAGLRKGQTDRVFLTSDASPGQTDRVFLTSDASPRHAREIGAVAPGTATHVLPGSMETYAPPLGKKSCVFAAADRHFGDALFQIYQAMTNTDTTTE